MKKNLLNTIAENPNQKDYLKAIILVSAIAIYSIAFQLFQIFYN